MKRREGAPFTEAQLKLIRFAAVEAEYQYLIDDLMCAEEPTRKRYFNEDELTSCAIKKSSKSREMLTFFSDYGDLDAVFTKCSIKARRIDLELRFPPYDFMKRLSGDVWPQAYDADTFLECVKSRL